MDGCVPNISAMAFKGFLKRIGITFFHAIAALTTPHGHYTDRTKINYCMFRNLLATKQKMCRYLKRRLKYPMLKINIDGYSAQSLGMI